MRTWNPFLIVILILGVLGIEVFSQIQLPSNQNKKPSPALNPTIIDNSKPDLQIISAKVTPSTVEQGQKIKIDYIIKIINDTPLAKSGVPITKFYLSIDPLFDHKDLYLWQFKEEKLVPGINILRQIPVDIPQDMQTGDRYVIVRCDANAQVQESNESNNFKATGLIKIIKARWIDLQITSEQVVPTYIHAGGQVKISYTIKNNGTGTAGPSVTNLYLLKDKIISSSAKSQASHKEPSLPPQAVNSASFDVNISQSTDLGTRYILLCCDATKKVPEKFEDNNLIIQNFEITDYVIIGNQKWMYKNLDAITFRNGDPIDEIKNKEDWIKAGDEGKPAWCNYNDDQANDAIYGKLYNWFAVNDPRGLAPKGWHVPSDAEWKSLADYLGGETVAGGKMKEIGTAHWKIPNTGATNESGFNALPSGYCKYDDGTYMDIDHYTAFWSSTENEGTSAWTKNLYFNTSDVKSFSFFKQHGFTVRCVKD